MTYVVRIVGPSGMVRYLRRGRVVENQDNATHYSHPSAAKRAAADHERRKYPVCSPFKFRPAIDVFDPRDPERQV